MPRVLARTEDSMNCTNSISYAHHVEYIEPSLFDLIPEELGRLLLQYLDIPSLSVLSILSRSSRISLLASDDVTWLGLVHQRFKIISSPVRGRLIPLKAKTYGGPSWKTAYRSMSICNRMPRNKIVKRSKTIFARGGGRMNHAAGIGKNDKKIVAGLHTNAESEIVYLWVSLAHTDNCNTRADGCVHLKAKRYVELHLCIQNVKSSLGSVFVDVTAVSAELLGFEGCPDGVWTSQVVQNGPRKPKILYQSQGSPVTFFDSNEIHMKPSKSFEEDRYTFMNNFGTNLKPLEFVVISVHVPCTFDMIYETDFLSRAVKIHVPIRWESGRDEIDEYNPTEHSKGIFDLNSNRSGLAATHKQTSFASAFFIQENEIWEHYTQLPGGCLTLTNRSSMVPV